jgi:hypothetical protein
VESVKIISKDMRCTAAAADPLSESMEPLLFYFLEASSGSGKTQLAFALDSPVIAINFGGTQDINACFGFLSEAVLLAIKNDVHNLHMSEDDIRSRNLVKSAEEFETVGLLVALYRLAFNKTNQESMRMLSGYDGELRISYRPMTPAEGRSAVRAQWEGRGNNSDAESARDIPLFFLDEVPSKRVPSYTRCILLRNFIRCLRSVSLLAGTEAAAMNSVDIVNPHSRGPRRFHYLKLIVDLPPLKWDVFDRDERYSNVTKRLPADVLQHLQATRPLFAETILQELAHTTDADVTRTPALTAAVLSAAKQALLAQKGKYSSDEGLYAQSALLFASSLHSEQPPQAATDATTDDNDDLDAVREQELQRNRFIIRHHFGELQLPPQFERPGHPQIIPLNCVPSGDNGDLSAETLSGAWQLFWPQVGFAPPHRDPFLYLINLRDGLYCTAPGNPTSQRLSVSPGMVRIHRSKLRINPPHFRNTRQSSPAGKVMEAEVGAAAVIASHSYSSLAGCPLQQFLPTFIAELNAFVRYTGSAQFAIADMPRQYGSLLVGLLSPPNLPWTDKQGGDLCSMQGGSVVLGNYCWSANEDRNDGSFPVQCDGNRVSGCLEAKCHAGVLPTRELVRTIANTTANNHTITIMVVTDFAAKKKLTSNGYPSCGHRAAVGLPASTSAVPAGRGVAAAHSGDDRARVHLPRKASGDEGCVRSVLRDTGEIP